jgi:redox-sensitive bicupin YhaK (pirin superfamily)
MPVGTGDTIHLRSLTAGKAMLLSGAPLNEPVASYGPFVMNTSREIMQALEDAQLGRMGELLENFDHA